MIARPQPNMQVLSLTGVRDKLRALPLAIERALRGDQFEIPLEPGRDVQILNPSRLPDKKGLSTREGQARLLHDLASIELQAMELGFRTLNEYPEAPGQFRQELAEVIADEGRHLGLCLGALEELEMPWGTFPAHIGLWQAVRPSDSLLDRILIVHRYLEGSGLDASQTILRRLGGVKAAAAYDVVKIIRADELGHVQFGSRWYHNICLAEKLGINDDFKLRLKRLEKMLPNRREPLNIALRRQAGFLPTEIAALVEKFGALQKPPAPLG